MSHGTPTDGSGMATALMRNQPSRDTPTRRWKVSAEPAGITARDRYRSARCAGSADASTTPDARTVPDMPLQHTEVRLRQYLNAKAKVLAGLTAQIDGRQLTLTHLGEIRHGIAIWSQRVEIARLQTRLLCGGPP